jgi:thioredoxin 1
LRHTNNERRAGCKRLEVPQKERIPARAGEGVKLMEYRFTKDNFEEEVVNSSVPVLVDFYADWCGPCKMMGPVVEKLAEEYEGKAKVGKVNVDDEEEFAARFNVMSIPFFAVIKDGKLVDSSLGATTKDALAAKLDAVL